MQKYSVVFKMSRKENEWYAKRVAQVFSEFGRDRKKTVDHFACEVACDKKANQRRVVNRIIDRAINENMNMCYKKITGRPTTKTTPDVLQSIENSFKSNPSLSVRDVAADLDLTKSTVSYGKTKKLKIVAFRKTSSPKYRKDQATRSKKNSRKIYENFLGDTVIIMDDESYCPADPTLIPRRDFFHCRKEEREGVSVHDKIKEKEKYPKQFMVWQAIDELGNKTEAFITNKTTKSIVYLEECLKKRLMPFIEEHHPEKNVLFWFDMATCHYAKEVKDWLIENGIKFIEKKDNTPNCPQVRPIEMYWAVIKHKFKKNNVFCNTIEEFASVWKSCEEQVQKSTVQSLMKRARRNLRAVGRNGVYATLRI